MNDNSLKHNRFILFGTLLSVFIFAFHYFLIEKPVSDHRLTLTIASAEYQTYITKIGDYKYSNELNGFFMSTNFESKADTLKDQGVRRFELRVSSPNTLDFNKSIYIYFSHYQLTSPTIVGNANFGTTTPLQKSLGYSFLFLSIILSIEFMLRKRSRKKQNK